MAEKGTKAEGTQTGNEGKTTPAVDAFDVNKFAKDLEQKPEEVETTEEEKKEVVTEEKKQPEVKEEEETEEEKKTTEDEEFDFDKEFESVVGKDKEEEVSEEEDKKEEEKKVPVVDEAWKDDAKELGIEAKDRKEYLEKTKQLLAASQANNAEPVAKIDKLLQRSDKELYSELVKGQTEWTDEEVNTHVEEYVKLHGEEGLKLEAAKIRAQLKVAKQNVIKQEADRIEGEKTEQKNFFKTLEESVDKMDKVYGMKITDPKQKQELKALIQSGEYHKILSDPKAFLRMIYWEKNHRALLGKVIERAQINTAANKEKEFQEEFIDKKILNKSITSTRKTGHHVERKTGEFNVEAFVKDLT